MSTPCPVQNPLLWEFTEYHYDDGTPNYYYELYNPYSHQYLAPQLRDGQTLSDSKIGINMPGRRCGDYYTDILAWDTPYYAYAGLISDIENKKVAAAPKADADTFYFAIVERPSPNLNEAATVDHTVYGITMKMIDFPVQPDSTGHSRLNEFLGTGSEYYSGATRGLLSTDIDPATGYPKASCSGNSLGQLFGSANEVNHLFLESIYYESGYFEFDSSQNFATLVRPDGTIGNEFTVYRELGTVDVDSRTTLKHGQFLPYNTITAGVYAVKNPLNLYSSLAQLGNPNVGKLPESDPRKYEKLHLVNGTPNYYNGTEMTARMVQSPSGKDSWGHDIVFEFTGDDDFWFYVDNELVIDLGGIHSALHGSVNFATGKVIVDNMESDLRTIFRSNYLQRNPDAEEDEVNTFLAEYFDGNENVFKDYTSHEIHLFYMERGAGASNLHMRFNLDPITPGNVLLNKEVSGTENIDFNLVEYPFQIWYRTEGSDNEFLLTNDDFVRVTYQNSIRRVNYQSSYTPHNSLVTYDSVYFLNPGKSAEIRFPDHTTEYKIVECGINYEVYDRVSVNGTVISGTVIPGTDRKSYDSGWMTILQRPIIQFDNHVNTSSLRTLRFAKRLFDESGNELTAEQDSTGFDFRLYLSNGSDDNLVPANMVKYYVTDHEGMLCTWDQESRTFVASGQNDYAALSPDQRARFTFETSMYGAISQIPSGYCVEVPNLPVGTKFMVLERENEIPAGYRLQSYERIDGSYRVEDGDTLNSGWVRANESPKMTVNNQRGWCIEVKKVWSDMDFSASHDPVYVGVYCGNTLIPDTVGCIAHPSVSKRYFFDGLMQGADFEDYRVYELELDDPVVNAEGELVSYRGIHKRLENGEPVIMHAVSRHSGVSSPHSYSVTYDYGTPYAQGHGTNVIENAKKDTITNTRTDGVVITLYDMHTNEPLAGGRFTLREGETSFGSFVSDTQGRITVFYDFERDTDYTLTQTAAPAGYIGLPHPVVFTVTGDDTVDVSGNGQQWQKGRVTGTSGDNLIVYIDVYNKPYHLTACKVDSVSGAVLSGAHFALYRSVDSIDGMVKDLYPIPGYADLVTGDDGIIPGIDRDLEPGKYYLTETAPPIDYKIHDGDIVFTISADGTIRMEYPEQTGYLTVQGTDECCYILRIPDEMRWPVELTISKTVTGAFGDKSKDFTFTLSTADAGTADAFPWSKNGVLQTEPLHNHDSFFLRHGDSVTVMIPENTLVTVSEANLDYTTSMKLNDAPSSVGNTKTFRLTDHAELLVKNNLNAVIPSGVFNHTAGAGIMMLAAVFLLIFLVILIRNHQKRLTA